MVLPRLVLIVVLGWVSVAAAFVLSKTVGDGGGSSAPAAEADSGRLSVTLAATELEGAGAVPSGFKAELTARFQGRGETETPEFDITVAGEGGGESFEIGAVSAGDRGFVRTGGKSYELPPEVWGELTALRGQLAELGRGAAGAEGAPALDMSAWLADREEAGTEQVGGVEAVHTSGRLDVEHMLRDLSRLEDSGIAGPGAGLGELPVEPAAVAAAVKEARVDLFVGRDDGILRRLAVDLRFEVPKALRERAGGLESGRIALTVELSELGQEQEISAPGDAEPMTPDAVDSQAAGVGVGLLAAGTIAVDPPPGLEAAASRQAGAAPEQRPASGGSAEPALRAGNGLPGGVARALRRDQVVVIFFGQRKASDDAATRASVRALRGRQGVAVFTADVRDLADYRRVVGGLDISQAPATVIVGRDGTAEVVHGYADAKSLAQRVRDAR